MKKYYIAIQICFFMFVYFGSAQEEVWFAKGEKAYKNKEYLEAINSFSEVIKLLPDNKEAHYFRGLSYLYTDDIKAAEDDFSIIINLDSNYSDAYNNRGLCYGYFGNINEAIADFKKAIELNPKFDKAYLNLGSAYLAIEKYEEALKAMNKVVKLDPKNAENYFLRGSVYIIRDSNDAAIRDFTKAIDLGLKISKTYFNRGNAYFKAGKYLEAVDDMTKVIDIDSTDIEALNNRSIAYSKIGFDDLAKLDRSRIVMLTSGGDELPNFDDLKFKTYSFMTFGITIELPDGWNSIASPTDKGQVVIITRDSVDKPSDPYHSGVRMAFDSNMYAQYQVLSKDEILSFWEYSTKMNEKFYKEYQQTSKVAFEKDGYSGYIKESTMQVDQNSYPIGLIEVVLAKEDKLFYSYFQAPKVQWDYYKKIFEKAIESLHMGI